MSLFSSFISAGFESACHINSQGKRLDMIRATQHDLQVETDYANLRKMGIRTARDGVRWHLIERGGLFDFSSLAPMVDAAVKHDIQVIWTLCHYGWPTNTNPLDKHFPERFAAFCDEVARFIKSRSDAVPFYTPINEISFLAAMAGEEGWMSPYRRGQGAEMKYNLVSAAIAGMNAIWNVDSRARFVHVEPLINVLPPRARPEKAARAAEIHESQFESSDMIAGRRNPELGGSMQHLDIMGLNFYAGNQWEHLGDRVHWHIKPRDPRWKPLHQAIREVHERYGRPLMLGETSHVGVGRAEWMREITSEIVELRKLGIPFEGICLYPAIDRYDWENELHWHNSGLWDVIQEPDGTLTRMLHEEYADAVREAQKIFDKDT
jgi:hypothetical protein